MHNLLPFLPSANSCGRRKKSIETAASNNARHNSALFRTSHTMGWVLTPLKFFESLMASKNVSTLIFKSWTQLENHGGLKIKFSKPFLNHSSLRWDSFGKILTNRLFQKLILNVPTHHIFVTTKYFWISNPLKQCFLTFFFPLRKSKKGNFKIKRWIFCNSKFMFWDNYLAKCIFKIRISN